MRIFFLGIVRYAVGVLEGESGMWKNQFDICLETAWVD